MGELDLDAHCDGAAVEHLKKCVALDPKQPDAYCDLGQVYQGQGDTKQAEDALRHCLMLDPGRKSARDLLEKLPKPAPATP